MRNILLPLSGIACLGLAAFALPAISEAEDELPAWQQAQIVGEAQSCVPLRQIRDTTVRDNRTIDFRMSGGRVYRNTLPFDCSGLRFERSFSYQTSLSQLCSTDIITVLRQPIRDGLNGPRCGLGEFVPVELPEG